MRCPLSEFAMYIVFMFTFCVATLLSPNSGKTPFWMAALMKTDILTNEWDQWDGGQKSFWDIDNPTDVYDYIKFSVLPTLITETGMNGSALPPEERLYPHSQRLLGIRLRLLRVRKDTCGEIYNERYAEVLKRPCWGDFTEATEDTADFIGARGTVYKWTSADENKEVTYNAKLQSYPGSGYVEDVELNLTAAVAKVDQLRADRWIDEHARAVFVDFQTFNQAADLFMVGRTIIEMPASGGFRPFQSIQARMVPIPTTGMEYMGFVADCMVLIFVVGYFVQEVQEMRKGIWEYTKSPWNVFDIMNICFFIISYIMKIRLVLTYYDINPVEAYPEYLSIYTLASLLDWLNFVTATNALLLWVKILKYFAANPRVMFLITTIVRARAQIFSFGMVFFIVLMSFGHAGYLAFSDQSLLFRSIYISIFSVFQSTSGDFDGSSLTVANRIFGPIYSFLFQFMLIVILLNVFLAIMNSAYMEVREELNQEKILKRKHTTTVNFIGQLFGVRTETQRRLLQDEEYEKAALKIQCCWRRRQAKQRVIRLKRAQDEEIRLLDERLAKLQASLDLILQMRLVCNVFDVDEE